MRRFVSIFTILCLGLLMPDALQADSSKTKADQILDSFEICFDDGDGFCIVKSKQHFFEEPIDVLNTEIFHEWLKVWFSQKENQHKQELQFVPVVRSCYVGDGKKVRAKMGFIYGDKSKVKVQRRRSVVIENKTTKVLEVVLHPDGIFPRLIAPGKQLRLGAPDLVAPLPGEQPHLRVVDEPVGLAGPQMLFVRYQRTPDLNGKDSGAAFSQPLAEVPEVMFVTEELLNKQGGMPCACRSCSQQY